MQCVHVQSRGHDQGGAARLQAKKLRELPGEAEAGDVPRGEERACACSAHTVRMQCAHAVRMQCSSRGAPSSATVDAGMPKPRRKVSQKVVYTMARSKVSEERERSFLRP